MSHLAAPGELLQTILEFIQADSWPDLHRVVKAHPELLDDGAEALLAELAAAQEDDWARQLLEKHCTFLARCREVGLGAAFAERMGGSADLSQALESLAQLAAENLKAIQAISQAVGQAIQENPLWAAVRDFTATGSPVELANAVRAHPALLSDEANELIHLGIRSARALGQEGMARYIEERYELLRQLCELGAPDILATMGVTADLSPKTQISLDELDRQGIQSAEELERAQARYPELQTALVRATVAVEVDEPAADYHVTSTRATGAPVEIPPGFEADIITLHSLPDTHEALEKQIEIYQRVLRRLNRTEAPIFWGAIQNNLANALYSRICGDRAENLEQAIHHYQQALKIYTRDDFPADWAMTQNNLAAAFYSRIHGERAENLEQAIYHYQQALEVRTRINFPLQWASTQNNLATALRDRICGDRAEDLERAIHHYQQALQIYIRDDFPVDWAMIQDNLGLALANRICGDREENLEQALAHFQAALQVYTRDDFPIQWATAQNNLGNALRDRICGDRAENLEQALAHFQAALQVYTRDDFPADWAATQNNLGLTLADRICGNRTENLERAVTHFQGAIAAYQKLGLPEEERKVRCNLSRLY